MILMIDNFDSFTYNIVQAVEDMGIRVVVCRNDAIAVPEIEKMAPDGIIISPGPGTPRAAGVSLDVVKNLYDKVPIFGVCLGHQCIAEAFGARIVHAGYVMHGKYSPISHDSKALFEGIPQGFNAVRYHSLVVEMSTLDSDLIVCARSDDDEIMGLRHKMLPVFGVQFHPESIATEHGYEIIKAFVVRTKEV